MNETRKKQGENYKDYISIMFRKKNELYHHKAVNRIIYYENNNNPILNKHFPNNNNFFFTGSCDSIIKLWINTNNQNPNSTNNTINTNNKNSYLNLISNFEFHSNWISSLLLCKKNNLLISSSYDESICIWDINKTLNKLDKNSDKTSFPEIILSHYHNDYISCLNYNEENNILYSSGLDGIVYSSDLEKIQNNIFDRNIILKNESSIYSIDVFESILAVSLYLDNTIKIIDLKSNKEICSLHGHNDIIKKIKLSPDGKNLISISSDKTIKFWDISNQKFIFNFDYHKSSVNGLFINKNFNKMISGSLDGDIYICDFEIQNYAFFDNIYDSVLDISMNEKEDQIIASSKNGNLYIYDLFDKEKSYFNNSNHDFFIGEIPLIEEENKKICEISKDEIVDYNLMNNKIYSIIKYKGNEEKGEIINLLKMKNIKGSKNSTYKSLLKRLNEIDKKNLEKWCTLDIKTGYLNMTLNEDKCYLNDITKVNLNFIEDIIKRNFSIHSESQLFKNEINEINEINKHQSLPNLQKMERKQQNSFFINKNNPLKKSTNEIPIENSFGNYIFNNIIGNFIYNKLINDIKNLFENEEEKIEEQYNEFFKKNEDVDDLFINTSISGIYNSFYLNHENKISFPSFCFKAFNQFFYDIYQEHNNLTNNKKYDLKIEVNLENVIQMISDNNKDIEVNYQLKSYHTFFSLFKAILKKLDLNKIKKVILEEIKNNNLTEEEIDFIKNKYLDNNEQIIKSFYFKTKNNIILNKKNCENKKISYVMKILNKGDNDSYTLFFCYRDIKSVLKIFGTQ